MGKGNACTNASMTINCWSKLPKLKRRCRFAHTVWPYPNSEKCENRLYTCVIIIGYYEPSGNLKRWWRNSWCKSANGSPTSVFCLKPRSKISSNPKCKSHKKIPRNLEILKGNSKCTTNFSKIPQRLFCISETNVLRGRGLLSSQAKAWSHTVFQQRSRNSSCGNENATCKQTDWLEQA